MIRYYYLGYLDTSGYRLEDDLEVINHLIDADLQDITKLETDLQIIWIQFFRERDGKGYGLEGRERVGKGKRWERDLKG